MIQNKRAFSIIEVLIYIQIVGFIFLLISNLGLEFQRKLDLVRVDLDEKIKIALAADLFYRDLLSGVGEVAFWDLENNVFRKKYLTKNFELVEKDICWVVLKNKLVRIEGIYDYHLKNWKHKIDSFLGNCIKSIEMRPYFTYNNKNINEIGVIFYLNSGKKKEFYVSLQNKVC